MPLLLSPLRATGLVAVLLTLPALLGACSGSDAKASPEGSSTRSGTTAAPAKAPRAGECRDLGAADVAGSSDDTTPGPCTAQHTSETFAVGEFPDRVAAAGYDDQALGRYMYATCGTAYLRFLGGDDSAALRSLFSWAWFRASEEAWDQGDHSYRCDLIGGPEGAEELRRLPSPSARGYLAGNPTTSPHQEWTLCARGTAFSRSTKVPCSTRHDWRAATTIKLGDPTAKYPGARLAQVRTTEYCSDSIRAYLGYPAEDYDYASTVFGQAEWQAGNRRSVCWARTGE